MDVIKQLLKDIEKRYNVEAAWVEYSLFNWFYTVRLRFETVNLNLAYVVSESTVGMVNTDNISYEAFRNQVFAGIDGEIQKYVHNTFYKKEKSENGN